MIEIDFFMLFMLGLASFRLTRLIVFDVITENLRGLFLEEVKEDDEQEGEIVYMVPRGSGVRKFIGELISCYWCTGMWVSILLVILLICIPEYSIWLFLILSVAAIGSILETIVQKLY